MNKYDHTEDDVEQPSLRCEEDPFGFCESSISDLKILSTIIIIKNSIFRLLNNYSKILICVCMLYLY